MRSTDADPIPEEEVVDGCPIHLVDAGPTGGEAVVLIHGITATHRFFRANIAALARRRRVLAPDLPGFGRSGKPDTTYATDYFVDVLRALLERRGLDRVHLVGHSMGGQIAMRFALAHPARVDRLVLVAPAGVSAVPMRLFDALFGGAALLGRVVRSPPRIPRHLTALTFHLLFPGNPETGAHYARAYARTIGSDDFPLHFRAGFRAMRGVLATPLRRAARAITHPTLIMWGGRDRLIPVTAARPLRRTIPDARLLIYRDSGHCPMVDQAARWNRDLERFLDGERVGR